VKKVNSEKSNEEQSLNVLLKSVIEDCYLEAEQIYAKEDMEQIKERLGEKCFEDVSILAKSRHAARGVVLTLAVYKVLQPDQDIRLHKAEFEGGFAARSIDNQVTVPFLEQHSLQYNVGSHWLTQTFSFAGALYEGVVLKTVPKVVGPLTVKIVNEIEKSKDAGFARDVVILILTILIDVRNRGKVALIKPKNLSIDQVIALLFKHFNFGYKKNTPRLPQIAVYALYQCLMVGMERYSNFKLRPLERLKTANRKSGSVGDIDVELNGKPIEAAEIKYQIAIAKQHVAEAIQKIRTASVERYFILSTLGIENNDINDINRLREEFLRSNGCEIIVNGVYETIKYYLRLLRSTNDFIIRYTELLEIDQDLDYEQRLSWNEICVTSKEIID